MRLLGWLLSSLLFLAVVGVAGVLGALAYFGRDLPEFEQLAEYKPPVVTRLHAADGRLLAEYAIENRIFVPIGAMPPLVVQAFVSAEDKNFYRHPGVDLEGVIRAAVNNLRNAGTGQRPEGASTITQQVAKNFLLSNELSYERKIREMLLALKMERTFSKDQILELYLNQIYLGLGAYGVAAAAINYFDKPLAELTLAEAAYLAGLPKAPNNYHPTRQYEAAVARRDYVLDRMVEDGVITPDESAAARAEPLQVVARQPEQVVEADYFAEEVRRELKSIYGDETLYQGGLFVRTTLETRLQTIADRVLRQGLIDYDRRHGWRGPIVRLDTLDDWAARLGDVARPAGAGDWRLAVVTAVAADAAEIGFADGSRGRIPLAELQWARSWREGQGVGPEPNQAGDVLDAGDVVLVEPVGGDFALRQIPDVQGALVAMDPHTGRVLAVSGGFSYEMSEFDRATQAVRQPGSAFKPFVYLTALEHGYTPSTILQDTPLTVDLGPGAGTYSPENYGDDYLGAVPLRVGIEKSRNIMTVRLLMDVGLEPVRDTAKEFGVYEEMPLYYSMALGAGETTLLRLTTAYAMLVNGGRRITPTFIDRLQDRDGRTIYRHDERVCAVCQVAEWDGQPAPELPDEREQVTDPVTAYQMVSMLEGVVQRGTAARSVGSLGLPLAGKTGTTDDSKDVWFVGFSPDLAVGVFVGFDEPKSLGARETGGTVAAPIFAAFMAEALRDQEVPPFRIPPGVSLVPINPATGQMAAPGGNTIWEAYRPGTEPGSAGTQVAANPAPDPYGLAASYGVPGTYGTPDSYAMGGAYGTPGAYGGPAAYGTPGYGLPGTVPAPGTLPGAPQVSAAPLLPDLPATGGVPLPSPPLASTAPLPAGGQPTTVMGTGGLY